jgi:hypothetical protein
MQRHKWAATVLAVSLLAFPATAQDGEPLGQLLGQCGDGELLLIAED